MELVSIGRCLSVCVEVYLLFSSPVTSAAVTCVRLIIRFFLVCLDDWLIFLNLKTVGAICGGVRRNWTMAVLVVYVHEVDHFCQWHIFNGSRDVRTCRTRADTCAHYENLEHGISGRRKSRSPNANSRVYDNSSGGYSVFAIVVATNKCPFTISTE